jgi:3-deoxy-7-phosphoheptulonate synthase
VNQLKTDDLRITQVREVSNPNTVCTEYPATDRAAKLTVRTRQEIHNILHGHDDRLLVIVGPCSIHDPKAALEYASRLLENRHAYGGDLLLVMRVYFEKPRTTVGWKGLINDPNLDGSYDIGNGLRIARKLLLDLNDLGIPAGTEYLDLMTPQYIADLISWGAIGARTTESQLHREMASGLSCPVGFKNGTDGNLRIAVDAVGAANHPHHFLTLTKAGHSAIFSTNGNDDCHLILRGGIETNYDEGSVRLASTALHDAGVLPAVMIDFSHANSRKQFDRQLEVCTDVCQQVGSGNDRIIGVMVESHLVGGRQDMVPGRPLKYGQSITDACIGWEETVGLFEQLAQAVATRRSALQARTSVS